MAGLIPQTFIDDLLDRIDIVDVVDSRVKLKKTGKNYSACCPFHDEKTPSFTVSPDKQFYYCFGCGASGTALGFVLEYDRLNFPDAVEELAKLAGLQVPREARSDSPKDQVRKSLYLMLDKADQYYRQQLRQNPARYHATNYLQQRGLSGEIARDFGIGYAAPGWDNLLTTLASSETDKKLLTECGMLIERPEDGRRYDRFRNRIMFPIRDTRGRVIGFGGRVLDDSKPKYLNSPETPVFHKGHELYGLYEARQAYRQLPRLLVVEGYMDVVALAQFGIRYSVATLGTACGEEHLTRAFKYTQEIVFCFDGDQAGRNAARRALENSLPVMQDGRQVKFLFLPDGEDPDTLVRQVGAEKFSRMIELAIPLEDFLFDSVADGIDIRSMEGRARFSKRAAPLLHRLPSGVFRELMFANLAQRTGLPIDTLMELVQAPPEESLPRRGPEQARSNQARPGPPQADQTRQALSKQEPSRQELSRQELARQERSRPERASSDHSQTADSQPVHTGAHRHGDSAQHTEIDARYPEQAPAHLPPPAAPPRSSYNGPIKLPPARFLCAMLLQHPELAAATPAIPAIEASDSSDLELFLDLLNLLRQRPNYNLPRILGHWRATRDSKSTDQLAHLAATEVLSEARQRQPFNARDEYLDCLLRLEQKLNRDKSQQLLNSLSTKNFSELSAEEKQQIRELHSQKPVKPG
ncbi:MAG: DNA primase [Gammaproteobacteria bacterium]|nr:DNA primase [Gammaproteobacteria bacterium]